MFFVSQAQEKELTFFLVSDTHYGASETIAGANRATIDMMKKLPGEKYPDHIGGVVNIPEGVIHCGDILDNGHTNPGAWQTFRADYGVNGEGRINYPVYETFGNHDGGINDPVRKGIIERNKKRPGVKNISDNGLHYSWEWENIHFVNLNLYPGNDWDSTCEWCHYFKDDFRFPLYSLDFLREDLKKNVGNSGRKVILIQHYGWDGFSKIWWTEAEKEAYHEVIKDYNIIAIFHGHSHGIEKFSWEGIDIWSVGSGQRDPNPGNCLVVRITGDQMLIAERRENQWGQIFKKPVTE